MVVAPLKPPMAKIMSSITSMAKLERGLYMSGMGVHVLVAGLYFSQLPILEMPLKPPANNASARGEGVTSFAPHGAARRSAPASVGKAPARLRGGLPTPDLTGAKARSRTHPRRRGSRGT